MQAAHVEEAAAEICAALRGEPVEPRDPKTFVELAVGEGVAPVIWRSGLRSLPPAWLAVLRDEVRCQLVLSSIREAELGRVLGRLARAGVDALVVKGAHLAYAFYDDPALRPRNDTDLLIRPGQEGAARDALHALGYHVLPAITGTAVQGQTIFDRDGVPGAVLDVHWRLSAPIVAARIFDFGELWERAQPLPALGSAAKGPHLLDAVGIAAVHLMAHHPTERGLMWLHDLHVLLRSLDTSGVAAFAREAGEKRMTTVCVRAVRRAEACFPSAAGGALVSMMSSDETEPSASLGRPTRPSNRALADVRALHGWRARTSYVAGHLFPPSDYMRRRYAPESRAPIAWLYAARILRGAPKWLRRA